MKPWIPAILALCLGASAAAKDAPIFTVNGRIPLGIESFRLQPAEKDFYLMASAENSQFEGLYRSTDPKGHRQLFGADDKPVRFYPGLVQFRVTASTREKLLDDAPFDVNGNMTLGNLLRKLRFRVKVFHGLDYWYLQPTSVQNIGMPDGIPYNERIYRISFDLGKIPIEDRVVMEVLSPTGNRLWKFHLDLY